MKTLTRTTLVVAIMSFLAYHGLSQNTAANPTQKNSQVAQSSRNAAPAKFVDHNKDGICDNYQARMKNGNGANFIDKNGDGICDNRPNAGQGRGNRNGCGMGNQHRHGHGQGNCCRGGNGYQHRHGRGNQNAPAPLPVKTNDKN
jgi:hypothetical protein